ncbi:hypothetical protein BDP55DRAFT_557649 [Colletotrichum godetiae]|uniref:J domain-containing protein n=1 Tax=Colletotrichum godetiae TaxID=1209918 RepID=A0AAJ0AFE6_9PEZI|nr:uncharacterized protein BDP55DRAFT_557649 [Colletotrichum godetiae]KAK1672870.1 hypothetical protein BDP55DRAFT_557649 [Colletotrichum godetiae]
MSALPPDPYKILGVSKDAQLAEIRSAHRKLVLKCHPDKVQDPTLKAQKQDEFQKVQQAYEILSDENERGKYDDNVKLAELRKEMAKGMSANTSAPRAPAARSYEVRTAEPRPDTYKTTYRASPGGKPMYSTGYNSRSWDEEIHSRSNSIFEEPRARRAASYEKPSRQDDERDHRERDRERERERDKERERAERKAYEKAAKKAVEKAAAEKEERRQERKRQEKAEKEREKERKREAEDKSRRHKPVYIEDDESSYFAKSDKKKSSSTKEKDKRSRSIPRDGAPLREEPPVPPLPPVPADAKGSKYNDAVLFAASYMEQSRKAHPGLSRAQTSYEPRHAPPVAVPTPPAAMPFPPPPPPPMPTVEEDTSRRSKSRRSSETKTRDKSSHKKSSPTKEAPVPPSPNVVDASPSTRHMAQFASATSSPASTSPPKHLGRSATFTDGYNRPPPGPVRAQTFSHVPAESADTRGRGRSRLQPQVSEDSESEEERHYQQRSHRHRTHSPEAMSYETGHRTRYTVNGGRTVPVATEAGYASAYRDDSPPRKPSKHADYYNVRPPMPSREASYSGSSAYFGKVKTARYDDVQYSNIPHRYRDEYNTVY